MKDIPVSQSKMTDDEQRWWWRCLNAIGKLINARRKS